MQTNFLTEIREAVAVALLNPGRMKAVAGKKGAETWGIIFVIIPYIVNFLLLSLLSPFGFSTLTFWPSLLPLVAFFSMVLSVGFFAERIFKIKVDKRAIFRVMTYGAIVLWLLMLPVVFVLIGLPGVGAKLSILSYAFIWVLVAAYRYMLNEYKASSQSLVITLVVSGFIYFLVLELLGRIFMGGFYGGAIII